MIYCDKIISIKMCLHNKKYIFLTFILIFTSLYPLFSLGSSGKKLNKAPSMLVAKSDSEINVCAWSPDGTKYFTSWEDTLIVWDAYTNKPIKICTNITSPVVHLSFSKDGKYFVVITEDNSIIICHTQSLQELNRVRGVKGANILTAAFSNDNLNLEVPLDGINIYSCFRLIMTNKFIGSKLQGHKNTVYSLSVNPVTNQILSASKDGSVILWDISKYQMIEKFKASTSSSLPAVFSPSGEMFIIPETRNSVAVKNIYGDTLHRIKDTNGPVNAAVFSPDGSIIAFAVKTGGICLYDAETGKQISYLECSYKEQGKIGEITAFDFSRDGNYIIATTTEGYIFRWSLSGKVYAQSAAHTINNQNEIAAILHKLEQDSNPVKVEEYSTVEITEQPVNQVKETKSTKAAKEKLFDNPVKINLIPSEDSEISFAYKKAISTLYFGAGYTTIPTNYFIGDLNLDFGANISFRRLPVFIGLDVKLGTAIPSKYYPYDYYTAEGKKLMSPWLYSGAPGIVFGCELYSQRGVRIFFDATGGGTVRVLWNNAPFQTVTSPIYYGYYAGVDAGIDLKGLTAKISCVYDANFGISNSASIGYTKRFYPKKNRKGGKK